MDNPGPATDWNSPEAMLEQAFAVPRRDVSLLVYSWPAPRVDAWRLLAALPEEEGHFLRTADGESAGLGVAQAFEASGPGRGETIAHQAGRWLRSVEVDGAPGTPVARPRLYGSLGFEVEAPKSGRFVLPRWRYETTDRGARLTVAITGGEGPRLLLELERIWAALGLSLAPPPLPALTLLPSDPGPFQASVTRLTEALAAGTMAKVVLSRDVHAEAAAPMDGVSVLRRLEVPGPQGLVYAFRRRGAWFLGATPELLVQRRGQQLTSMALAGSAAPEADPAALLASDKDRREHALVVEHLVDRLRAVAPGMEAPPEPVVLTLPNLLHLMTPISATLERPLHVLALADRLHPTPAVAGTPLPAALAAIAAEEGRPRGLYSGAVGWFDGRGQGELHVALRAATLSGSRATCHVGVGLVAGSEPEAEWRETEWKAETMLRALGALP